MKPTHTAVATAVAMVAMTGTTVLSSAFASAEALSAGDPQPTRTTWTDGPDPSRTTWTDGSTPTRTTWTDSPSPSRTTWTDSPTPTRTTSTDPGPTDPRPTVTDTATTRPVPSATATPTQAPTSTATSAPKPTTTAPGQSAKVDIKLVTANGSGCADGATLESDGNTARVHFPGMMAEVGKGIAAEKYRRNCQVALGLTAPKGYTVGLKRSTVKGSAWLEDTATTKVFTNIYYQGGSGDQTAEKVHTGPLSGDVATTFEFADGDIQWLPCSEERYLNVNTSLAVNKGSSSAEDHNWFRADDGTGAEFTFVTKKC